MKSRFLTLLPASALVVALAPADALALTCDEIMNMVNVNVPASIIVQTMKDSGDQFRAEEVRCLVDRGAPAEIIAQAKAMNQAAAPVVPDDGDIPDVGPAIERDQDEIGSRRTETRAPTDEEGLPEAGGPSGDLPEELMEAKKLIRAKKPLTASDMLYQIIEDNKYPQYRADALYLLAQAFSDLEMYHAAQHHYMLVIKDHQDSQYFSYALGKLSSISRFTGDDTDLARLVEKIPPEAFPRSAANQFHYLLGLAAYSDGDLNGAQAHLSKVSSKSELYLKARYLEGIIANEQGRLQTAVKAFRDVYREEIVSFDDPREQEEVLRLKDLALLNIARIYYGIERYDESSKYYNLVSRESVYWPESLFENAWSSFMQNQHNKALGQLLTLQSPFYNQDEYIPEATILRALTFFNLCEYKEVEALLLDFEDRYGPMRDEMRNFVQGYATPEGKKLSDQAWNAYFGADKKSESVLPKAFFNRVLRNQDLAGIVYHLDMMDKELELIDNQKPQWRDGVGTYAKKLIEADRQRYEKRAGLLFLQEMVTQAEYLSGLMTQSEIIRFEVVDAQRVDYAYKAQNTDLIDTSDNVNLDYAVAPRFIYWPFNGEFWEDELGYYQYTEQGSCQ